MLKNSGLYERGKPLECAQKLTTTLSHISIIDNMSCIQTRSDWWKENALPVVSPQLPMKARVTATHKENKYSCRKEHSVLV